MTFGVLGAITVLAMVATDLLRRIIPDVSAGINLLPLALASLGAVIAATHASSARLPRHARSACIALVIMCLYGTAIAVSRGLPRAQVLAGWLAEAGAIPGLVLGFALALEPRGWRMFKKVATAVLVASVAVGLLQQIGFYRTEPFEMLPGARAERGLSSGATFRYTAGLFRTANVYASFLAFLGVVTVLSFSEHLPHSSRRHFGARHFAVIGLLLLGSLMAARRSGLIMLLGALVPFLFSAGRRLRAPGLLLGLAGCLYFVAYEPPDSSDIHRKLEFATTDLDLGGRLGDAFSVNPRDWDLVTIFGEGIGAVGPASQAGGEAAFRRDMLRLDRHRVLHVGWFKDLVGYGVVGATLHLAWFALLTLAVLATSQAPQSAPVPARWSGLGFLVIVIANYYLIATSWLQGLTGGLLFGLAIGLFLGRMRMVASYPDQNGTAS
jgi:hypothetical protein